MLGLELTWPAGSASCSVSGQVLLLLAALLLSSCCCLKLLLLLVCLCLWGL